LPSGQKFTLVTHQQSSKIGEAKMKRLAILTFSLGMVVAPFQAQAQAQAQAQKPVEFNGMVFDSPPAQGYQSSQGYEAAQPTTTTRHRTSTHHQSRHHHKHSAT
jgi:hypothetical protein